MKTRREFLRACIAAPLVGHKSISGSSVDSPLQTLVPHDSQLHLLRSSDWTSPEYRAIDDLCRTFVERAAVSAGQLAVFENGQPRFNKAYTNVVTSTHPAVTTNSIFRIASCSKIFTCAAIDMLRARGKLDMNLKVYPLLGIKEPASHEHTPDPRVNEITVQHLIDHAGGWNDHDAVKSKDGQDIPGTQWDPVFHVREIALHLGLSGPPTKRDIARFMYGQPLQFVPGSQNFDSTFSKSYSNVGFVLLGLVIEELTGEPYVDFVRSNLNVNGSTSNVYLARMLDGALHPREVWYEDPGKGPNALEPHAHELAPNAYGGEGFITELMDSGGGLMTNAETLAGFLFQHAVWGIGGRAKGMERSGGMAGTSSYALSRPNGVDCACIFNTRSFNGEDQIYSSFIRELKALLDQSGSAV
jgi:CubicO group peptidase (beta-lactamase class C family)